MARRAVELKLHELGKEALSRKARRFAAYVPPIIASRSDVRVDMEGETRAGTQAPESMAANSKLLSDGRDGANLMEAKLFGNLSKVSKVRKVGNTKGLHDHLGRSLAPRRVSC